MDRHSRRFLLLVVIAAAFAMLLIPVFRVAAQTDPIAAASERARAAGSYHFTSDVVQVTTPMASVANVGRATREQRIRLEGENDLRQQSMEMRLWAGGGSVLQNESAAAVRVRDGKTMVRDEMGVWKDAPGFTGTVAPGGDFLIVSASYPRCGAARA